MLDVGEAAVDLAKPAADGAGRAGGGGAHPLPELAMKESGITEPPLMKMLMSSIRRTMVTSIPV